MFPAFTAVASPVLLEGFRYSVDPVDVSQNIGYALMEENAAIVIDVRTKEEYAQSHIPNAYNFPVEELLNHLDELAVLKESDTPVLLYCRSGRRSGNAMNMLHKHGFKYLMNMGGIITWANETTTAAPEKPFADAVRAVTPLQNAK